MIDLHYLASKINETLGTSKYKVYLSTNANPEKIGDRNVVVMSVARIPYAYTVEELDAEGLNITCTFDLPIAQSGSDLITHEEALVDIYEKLLGWRSFIVQQPTTDPNIYNEYLVVGKFEQQPPSAPYVDNGRKTQQIVVSGQAWAQNINCKATVGNNVVTLIGDDEREPVTLLKISRSSSTQIGADNNLLLSEDKTMPEVHGISRACTKTLTFMYLGKEIEDEFLKIAEGATHDVNKIYTYQVYYPTFTLEQRFKLLSVSSQDSAGVYLQYTLQMQVID